MDINTKSLSEIGKSPATENKSFDPDKRIDINQKQDTKERSGYDVDKRVDVDEKEVNGGSYADVKKNSNGETHEVHHMPSAEASFLEFKDGPTIKMEKDDHRKTASWGRSSEAQGYREAQKELINSGKFREALQMDIDDISGKFNSKYDAAILEMSQYVDKLEMEGKI